MKSKIALQNKDDVLAFINNLKLEDNTLKLSTSAFECPAGTTVLSVSRCGGHGGGSSELPDAVKELLRKGGSIVSVKLAFRKALFNMLYNRQTIIVRVSPAYYMYEGRVWMMVNGTDWKYATQQVYHDDEQDRNWVDIDNGISWFFLKQGYKVLACLFFVVFVSARRHFC
jgi:hypothetical protein